MEINNAVDVRFVIVLVPKSASKGLSFMSGLCLVINAILTLLLGPLIGVLNALQALFLNRQIQVYRKRLSPGFYTQ